MNIAFKGSVYRRKKEKVIRRKNNTYPAHETIRVPLAVQGGDVVLHDGPVASVALQREHIDVIVATVRFAVALVEPILTELLATLGAEKVLRVPGLLQCCDAFLFRRREKTTITV